MLPRLALMTILSLLAVGFCFNLSSAVDEPKNEPAQASRLSSLNELSMEVNALQMLRLFRFSPGQMETLRNLAKETSQEMGVRQAPKASDMYRTALVDLRSALIDDDDERIDQSLELLDTLRHAENPEIDDGVEITDAALERAKEVFKRLSARQVAIYLVSAVDEIADPLEQILGAVEKVRGLEEKEWKQVREEVSLEVGRLIAGLDAEKAGRVGDKVVQLLIQARALTDEEFKTERVELEKEARQIVGEVGPLEVLGHLVEQALAELLSNPRLQTALDAVVRK